MSTKDSDAGIDKYQDELSNQTEDGGGCTETWSLLSKIRSDDPNNTNDVTADENRRSSRRKFLQSVGIGVASTVSLTEMAKAAVEQTTVTQLTGDRREEVLAKARREVSQTREVFAENGWVVDKSETQVTRTQTDEVDYNSVTFIYEASSGKQPLIIWSEWDETPTQGLVIDEDGSGSNIQTSDAAVPTVESSEPTVTVYEDGVATETSTLDSDADTGNGGQFTIQASSCKCGDLPNCPNTNYKCVALIVSSYGFLIPCGACAVSGLTNEVACGNCVTTALGKYASEINCDPCPGYGGL